MDTEMASPLITVLTAQDIVSWRKATEPVIGSWLKEMRARNPNLKIIFVSGYAEDAFAKSLEETEKFDFLPKPFALSALVAKVKETMAAP